MKVEIRKVLRGTAEEVYQAWTDPASVRHWMCPDPSVRITQLDWTVVEGASYRIEMSVDGEPVAFRGRFIKVEPDRRLIFSWVSSRTDEEETEVTVEITSVAEGAEVRLVHDALPTSEAAAEHAAGWENILARLGDYMGP